MKRLVTFLGAKEGKNWAVYRPYDAKFLTFSDRHVKTMAISDHNFGCRKLQFRTVQISKLVASGRNQMRGVRDGATDCCGGTSLELRVRCLVPHLHPDLFRSAHGLEHTAHDLRGAGATRLVGRL